jgi:hypothetical protein
MQPFTVCSKWVVTYYQRRITDISGCVLLRVGKRQQQYEYNFIVGLVDLLVNNQISA